jgi:glycosyltransferase involved in cell wall biosynthesis
LTVGGEDEEYGAGEVVRLKVKGRAGRGFISRRIAGAERRMRGWDWPYYGSYMREFRRALRRLAGRPDVVIAFNDLISQKYIRRELPNARIYSWLQNEWRTNQRDLSECVRATDFFLTCSGYIRDWTSRTHGIPVEKFAVVTSGVDLARFVPRKDFLRRQGALRALFIGRIDRNKGPDIAVEAVMKLREEGIDATITVAGGLWFYTRGDEMKDSFFRTLKGKIEVSSGGAKYLGHVTRDRVPELIREHDVAFVLSRSNEPFGLVVLEAMASGLAVISSDRGGLPEACGEAGILVDPDRPEMVVQELRRLATDTTYLTEQKRRSVARAASSPWREAAQRIVELATQRNSRLAVQGIN